MELIWPTFVNRDRVDPRDLAHGIFPFCGCCLHWMGNATRDGKAAGIGKGKLRDAHVEAEEGNVDLPADQESAAPARTHQAREHGALPRH